MTQQYIPIDQVQSNPYQTRTTENDEHLQALAEDIKLRGLLQVPIGRWVADGKNGAVEHGHIELAFGHSRLAAWKIACPDKPFPVEIRELTDRELSDLAAAENAKRKNLTAIEKARAIQRRVQEFRLTQLEAAEPFGYTSQGTISNLLRLLKLPSAIQDLVAQHKLAERNARALLVVEHLDPKETAKLATKSMSAENPEQFIDDEIEELLSKRGKDLHEAPWKPDWPASPFAIEPAVNGVTEIRACLGCPFYFARRRHNKYEDDSSALCGRAECYAEKKKAALAKTAAEASTKLAIPVAAEGEKVTVVYNGNALNYYDHDRFAKLVKAKLPVLRLVSFAPDKHDYNGNYREKLLGSEWLALATVDKAATDAWLKAKNESEREELTLESEGAEESEAKRKRRLAREEKEAEERREERSMKLRQKYETLWLIENTAKLIAERLDIHGAVVQLLEELVGNRFQIRGIGETLKEIEDALIERLAAAKDTEKECLRRQHIALCVLGHEIVSWNGRYDKDLSSICEIVADACNAYDSDEDESAFGGMEAHFGVSLPQGWERVPVLRTPFNCWHCGEFGSNEGRITKGEQERGWRLMDDGRIFCSEQHEADYGNHSDDEPTARAAPQQRGRKSATKKTRKKAK